MNIPVNAMANYIIQIYKPKDISVDVRHNDTGMEYVIFLYFDHIDDKYITNQNALDLIANKENNLQREIRSEVEQFFSTKTSGLDLQGFAPYKRHGLTINVIQNRTPR